MKEVSKQEKLIKKNILRHENKRYFEDDIIKQFSNKNYKFDNNGDKNSIEINKKIMLSKLMKGEIQTKNEKSEKFYTPEKGNNIYKTLNDSKKKSSGMNKLSNKIYSISDQSNKNLSFLIFRIKQS